VPVPIGGGVVSPVNDAVRLADSEPPRIVRDRCTRRGEEHREDERDHCDAPTRFTIVDVDPLTPGQAAAVIHEHKIIGDEPIVFNEDLLALIARRIDESPDFRRSSDDVVAALRQLMPGS
jgi:hypothetical protein